MIRRLLGLEPRRPAPATRFGAALDGARPDHGGAASLEPVVAEAAGPPPRMVVSERPDALPADLVASIEAATIMHRESAAHDGDVVPIVRIIGVGMFYWDGIEEAAKTLGRAYPELSPVQRRKAARLLMAQIGKRNQRVRPDASCNWAMDWSGRRA